MLLLREDAGLCGYFEQLATERGFKTQCLRPPTYGALKYLRCINEGSSFSTNPKKHWHRDINAAIHIGKAFIFAAHPDGDDEGLNISDENLNDWAFFKPGFLHGAIPAIEADDSVSFN